jgi:hypothetical protein
MPATVTTLTREIAREERCVGIRSDAPLTGRMITRRRTQLIAVLAGCGFVALFAIFAAAGGMQMIAVSLAGAFGIYAIEQDHHLRRLALLRVDSERISLHVASELMYSGALAHDRELFDLRDRAGVIAGELAVELAEVVPAACTRRSASVARRRSDRGRAGVTRPHDRPQGRRRPQRARGADLARRRRGRAVGGGLA